MKLWRRLTDWYVTQRTLIAIDNRECQHDGREPFCTDCVRQAAGGW